MKRQQKSEIKSAILRCWGIFLAATALFLLCDPSKSMAHGVYIYAWVDGDIIYTESYFGAKRKVKNGIIKVFDLSGKMLLQGETNEQGEFAFESPSGSDLRIVVEAGMGHQSEYLLKVEEPSPDVTAPESEPKPATQNEKLAGVNVEDLAIFNKFVEQTLDTKLKPIMRELAAIRHEKGPGLTEILGGIGYIFGIMGVMMVMKARKK